MELDQLARRAAEARERIAAASDRAGRTEPVVLVPVTKTHAPETVRLALAAGFTETAENRVQELEQKVEAVGRGAARWHLIGHLQRNKAARALPLFDLFHAVDSARLARALSAAALDQQRQATVLVQVNVSGEASKGGFPAAAALDAIGAVCSLPALQVRGLMTMAPLDAPERVLRHTFAGARRLFDEAARQLPAFQPEHLSMGMSDDFEIAVEEGSTMVRLGSALFGERPV